MDEYGRKYSCSASGIFLPRAFLDRYRVGGPSVNVLFYSANLKQNIYFSTLLTPLQTNQNKTSEQIFRSHELEKKRTYHQRIIEIEQGHFTPVVFGTNGGMGVEGNCFLKRLVELLSIKQDETYESVMTWLRTRLSFEIIRSIHLSIRGSRTPFRKPSNIADATEDIELNIFKAGL